MSSEIDENKQQEDPEGNIEEAPKQDRRATEDEIMEMCKFIGTFKHWPQLSDDIKKIIVEKLDYKERFNLSISSSADYRVVTSTPHFVDSIGLTYHPEKGPLRPSKVTMEVQFKTISKAKNAFKKVFVQHGEDTHIYRHDFDYDNWRLTPPQQIWKNCSCQNAAAKHAEELMEKGKFKIEELDVAMEDYPFNDSIIKKLPLCKNVRLVCGREEDFNWWIDKVADELDELAVLYDGEDNISLSTEFFLKPSVLNATEWFSTNCEARISDETLLQFKAEYIRLYRTDITDHGVNAFLKKWARGECVENFSQMYIPSYRVSDEVDIIRGLSTRVWDEQFKEETGDFCDIFLASSDLDPDTRIFQVMSEKDPYLSLTLAFSEESLDIQWTGRKTELNGKTITTNAIPEIFIY